MEKLTVHIYCLDLLCVIIRRPAAQTGSGSNASPYFPQRMSSQGINFLLCVVILIRYTRSIWLNMLTP